LLDDCFELRKEGKVVLNQERKDKKICRILFILASFLSWFKTFFPFYMILPILASFLSWVKTIKKRPLIGALYF